MDTRVADPLIGALLDGRYRIRGRIARGGMATVYHAVDERLERTVAIKVIHPNHADNRQFLDRFDREAKTIAQLNDPHIVAVFDTGSHAGLPFLVMEYVRGRTLRDVLAQRRRLPPHEALAIFEPMLAAVAAAHRAGLVHRDIKPENVLIGDDGAVKVADFGLARAVEASAEDATAGGQVMATVAYVPPELVSNGRADPRGDVYSAGIVLYEMLTGRVPYSGEKAVDVAYQHVERNVPPPSAAVPGLPRQFDELVVRATRRDPGARPTDAGAFLAEVRAAREDLGFGQTRAFGPPAARPAAHPTVAVPLGHQPPAPRPRIQPATRRPRTGLVAALVLLAVGLVAAIGGWWLGAGRYTDAPALLTMTRAQAEAAARDQGFKVDVEYRPHETVAKDKVFDQNPEPRQRIVKGGTITLLVSNGPDRRKVPDIVGRTRAEAEQALKQAGLKSTIEEQYSKTVEAGRVIAVEPKVGTALRPDTPVKLVLSKGEAPVEVPSVVDLPVGEARDELERLGLRVEVVEQFHATVEKDRVILQSPAAGTGVDKGATVKLTVSKGGELVTVPDVVDRSYRDAKRILERQGFKVSRIGRENGRVRSQSPGGGQQAPKGSTIQIFVV